MILTDNKSSIVPPRSLRSNIEKKEVEQNKTIPEEFLSLSNKPIKRALKSSNVVGLTYGNEANDSMALIKKVE